MSPPQHWRIPTLELSMTESSTATAPIRSYRDLRVWQQAMDLAEATHRATQRFPESERYGLVLQLRRGAVAVASNIAQGHARALGDYLSHLLAASGWVREVETQLLLSSRLGFLPPDDMESLVQACDHIARMLGALRKSLAARRTRAASP